MPIPEIALKAIQVCLAGSALVLAANAIGGLAASDSPQIDVGDLRAQVRAPEGAAGVADKASYAIIPERNLFHSATPAPPAPPPQPELVETQLEVELMATIAASGGDADSDPDASDPDASFPEAIAGAEGGGNGRVAVALLRDVDDERRALRVGDQLAEGRAVLVEIRNAEVVIRHEGQLEVLRIDTEAAETATRRSPAPRGRSRAAARRPRDSRAVPRRGAEAPRPGQNLDPLLASPLGPLLTEVGLRSGDRIVAIDGNDLASEPNPLGVLLDPTGSVSERLLTLEAADGSTREVVVPANIRERVEQALSGPSVR